MLFNLTAESRQGDFGGVNTTFFTLLHSLYFITSLKEMLLQCTAVESRLAELREDHSKQKISVVVGQRGSEATCADLSTKSTLKIFHPLFQPTWLKEYFLLIQEPGKDLIFSEIKCSRAFSHPSEAVDKTPVLQSSGTLIRFFFCDVPAMLCLSFSHVKGNCGNPTALLTL